MSSIDRPVSPHPLTSRAQRGAVKVGCIVGIVALLILGFVGYRMTVGTYNGFVAKEEGLAAKWAALEGAYKRRLDLIPQLMGVVSGAADFEKSTITEVTEARSRVGQITMPPNAGQDPAKVQEFMAGQQGVTSALSRLMVVMENYPTLTATGAFRDMQSQVEGTENRIAVARRDYIDAVQAFNTALRKFPANFIAGMYGFETREQLPQDSAAVRETPVIDFSEDDG